ncbi:MAG TPA: AMP-binding protein [Alphaproteobacteria bacterium]|nr:AMP-binding protein [Alphaproteobacteria bacterium]
MNADTARFPDMPFPRSPAEIAAIHSARKRRAVEQAKRAPFFRGKLDHIRLDRLDDPEEWSKIPILDKEMLRALSPEQFYREFCLPFDGRLAEYWRSGGTTGKPLFYPRSFEDIHYAMEGFRRTFACAGARAGDTVHVSMPLGIHPAGQMWARAAESAGIGVVWAGAGAAAPSLLQIDLLAMLKPSIWMGMSSYALHLANLAESKGVDLATFGVRMVMCTAEPLSEAKRAKIARAWGAEVYDTFGMTECTMMGAESAAGEGFRIWTDLVFLEVLHPQTLSPVADDEEGHLVVTPLFTNNATPFLRWSTGDIVRRRAASPASGPFGVFPLIKHAHRTTGFFKIRGINVNHSEFEDFMFADRGVNDFKAELVTVSGVDRMRLSVEFKRGASPGPAESDLARRVKATFEVTPEIVVLEPGTLAREFESSVKAPRFMDARR